MFIPGGKTGRFALAVAAITRRFVLFPPSVPDVETREKGKKGSPV